MGWCLCVMSRRVFPQACQSSARSDLVLTAGAVLPDGPGRAGPGAGPPRFMAAFSRLSRTHNTQIPLQDDGNRGCSAHCGYF